MNNSPLAGLRVNSSRLAGLILELMSRPLVEQWNNKWPAGRLSMPLVGLRLGGTRTLWARLWKKRLAGRLSMPLVGLLGTRTPLAGLLSLLLSFSPLAGGRPEALDVNKNL